MAEGGALWVLMLGTILFLGSFVLFVNMIPSEAYTPYKDYEDIYVGEDRFSATEMNVWNKSDHYNFTFTLLGNTDDTLNGVNIRFHHPSLVTGRNTFAIYHIEGSFWIFEWGHFLEIEKGFGLVLTEDELFDPIIYDELSDTSTILYSCSHIDILVEFSSSNDSRTLAESWDNNEVTASIQYEIDFSSMGANVWMLIATVLTFQVVKTGVLALDVLINALISIPVWVSIGYIIYRLVTGLIPTLSGGGGA